MQRQPFSRVEHRIKLGSLSIKFSTELVTTMNPEIDQEMPILKTSCLNAEFNQITERLYICPIESCLKAHRICQSKASLFF